jgi:catechol 2,3-dioxygenase-like lactoylglutathione lyase family enzyme
MMMNTASALQIAETNESRAEGRDWNQNVHTRERELAAARTFYGDVLGGRQVWPFGSAEASERLWFLVSGALIETGPEFRNTRVRVLLGAEYADDLAARCWDAGFTVQVDPGPAGRATLTLVDPFGRQIDLVSANRGAR